MGSSAAVRLARRASLGSRKRITHTYAFRGPYATAADGAGLSLRPALLPGLAGTVG